MSPLDLLSRRRLLQFGGGYLGLNLGGWVRARAAQEAALATASPVRACILVFYYGGPSHFETYDPKPDAPKEVRGEFQPISTSVPGTYISEHLPRMSRLMHKVALIRSVTHEARLHDSASIHALTGRPLEGPDRELFAPQPQTTPSYGSGVSFARRQQGIDIPFAALPFRFRNVHDVPCQGGGLLGSKYDPIWVDVDPAAAKYRAEGLQFADGLGPARVDSRRGLLDSLDPGLSADVERKGLYQRAYRLLQSAALQTAVDITQEPASVRERYGFGKEAVSIGEGGGGGNGSEMGYARHLRGQNLLLARRLVEAGIPFVNVYDFRQQGQNWDAHFNGANQHKNFLLPQADQSLSALIEDLDARGLLDTTLVVAMGEFGRTPIINSSAGRDHWPDCYTVLMAGGGIRGGAIYGASDRIGAYPARDPVTPGDIAATIYWRFGIDPQLEIHDSLGRPQSLSTGTPIARIFA